MAEFSAESGSAADCSSLSLWVANATAGQCEVPAIARSSLAGAAKHSAGGARATRTFLQFLQALRYSRLSCVSNALRSRHCRLHVVGRTVVAMRAFFVVAMRRLHCHLPCDPGFDTSQLSPVWKTGSARLVNDPRHNACCQLSRDLPNLGLAARWRFGSVLYHTRGSPSPIKVSCLLCALLPACHAT